KEMVASWCMMPSRSYHQEASGLPMISLIVLSISSGSIGRRNGRINSKLIVGPHNDGSPAVSQASESEEQGFMRPFPPGAHPRAPDLSLDRPGRLSQRGQVSGSRRPESPRRAA